MDNKFVDLKEKDFFLLAEGMLSVDRDKRELSYSKFRNYLMDLYMSKNNDYTRGSLHHIYYEQKKDPDILGILKTHVCESFVSHEGYKGVNFIDDGFAFWYTESKKQYSDSSFKTTLNCKRGPVPTFSPKT